MSTPRTAPNSTGGPDATVRPRDAAPLAWSSTLSIAGTAAGEGDERREAIERARRGRPRTVALEREIIIAVVTLYGLISLSLVLMHYLNR